MCIFYFLRIVAALIVVVFILIVVVLIVLRILSLDAILKNTQLSKSILTLI